MSPLVPGQADRFSPVELKLWTAVILERRGRPAVLRWPCCRAALFANVFGCLCRHRSSRAYVKGLHWKKKFPLSAGSISVLADAFKLGRDIIYNYQQSPDGGWSWNWRQLCCLSQNCSKCCPWARMGSRGLCRVRVLFASRGEILFLPKWYFCCCQNGDAKVGWFGCWEIPAAIRWVLASLWVSDFFTEMNLQLLSCCLCQRQSDVFLTVIFS